MLEALRQMQTAFVTLSQPSFVPAGSIISHQPWAWRRCSQPLGHLRRALVVGCGTMAFGQPYWVGSAGAGRQVGVSEQPAMALITYLHEAIPSHIFQVCVYCMKYMLANV